MSHPSVVLVVGVSTRAAAESARRAGFAVTAVDAFGDLDINPSVRSLSLKRDFSTPFSARAAAHLARDLGCATAAYLSNFENHPEAVRALAAGRTLWGNPPEVLRRVRDPLLVAEALRRRGIPFAAVSANGKAHGPNGWLVKPLASGGGQKVRPWKGNRVPRRSYLQERITGTPGSVVFVAAGGRAVPLGVSRQLIGDAAFGADGYRYCGNILASIEDAQFGQDEAIVGAASASACVVTEDFGLVGVNGIDFIAGAGAAYTVEVNPRWCGSMELVEYAYDLSVFGIHAAACTDAVLPEFDLARAMRAGNAVGKAVVFARRDVTVGDTRSWLAEADVRDVPHPGERIAARRPVCTVFGAGPDAAACYTVLVRRADRVYAELAEWVGVAKTD